MLPICGPRGETIEFNPAVLDVGKLLRTGCFHLVAVGIFTPKFIPGVTTGLYHVLPVAGMCFYSDEVARP